MSSPLLKADIKQLIRLLGAHLYADTDVAIRELIQNAYDAILGRFGPAATKIGRIDLRIAHSSNPCVIEVRDNGIGMSRNEMTRYLSVLGSSVKRGQDSETIGQFGIGVFSSFLIADRIEIISQKDQNQVACRWQSTGTETYEVDDLETGVATIGTCVRLSLGARADRFTRADELRGVVRKYFDFLGCHIYVCDEAQPANNCIYPWETKGAAGRLTELERHFGYGVGRCETGECTVLNRQIGYAFALSDDGKSMQEIHCRRVLVTRTLRLLPPYLDSLTLLLESPNFELTLGREDLINDVFLSEVREVLHELALDFVFGSLADGSSAAAELITAHMSQFAEVALSRPSYLSQLIPYVRFPLLRPVAGLPTRVSVKDYLGASPLESTVVFVGPAAVSPDARVRDISSSEGLARNVCELLAAGVCEERGIPVLEIASVTHESLLEKACEEVHATPLVLREYQKRLFALDGHFRIEQFRRLLDGYSGRVVTARDQPVPFMCEALLTAIGKLERLLESESGEEGAYQTLLQENPWMLGAQYERVEGHRRLDDENIPDFTAVRIHDGCRDVIEIKTPFAVLFGADGEPTAAFHRSWYQAERYVRFARENSDYLRREKDLVFENPRCLLVMGRDFTSLERRHVLTKQAGNLAIEVLTYDGLLRSAKATVRFFERMQGGTSL